MTTGLPGDVTPPPIRNPRLLTFRSGGWVLLLAGVLAGAVALWRIPIILNQLDHRATGDGRHVESYRFDLTNLSVSSELLAAAGFAKNGVPALDHLKRLTVNEAAEFHQTLRKDHRHKFVVDSDPVIGVQIDGVAAAYPTRILAWHMVVNDTIGQTPVLITFDPLCDSSVVFRRAVGGAPRTFGVSGLVLNGNLVFYDRRDAAAQESLWSQLQFKAISGPAVGTALEIIPIVVTSWGEWRAAHPETTIMPLLVERVRVYRQSYQQYYGDDEPPRQFPITPLPAHRPPAFKSPVDAIRSEDGGWRHKFIPNHGATTGPPTPVDARAFWFAWHAHHPDSVESQASQPPP